MLLAVSTCHLHAQLAANLSNLSQAINNLTTALTPKLKEEPVTLEPLAEPKSVEEPKREPSPAVIETWDQLVQTNKIRAANSKSLSQFNVAVQLHVIADAYQPIKDLQKAIQIANQDLQKKMSKQRCGKDHWKFHMTLLYLNIPIDLSTIQTAAGQRTAIKAVNDDVTSWIEKISWANEVTGLKSIKLLSFDYAGLKIISGKDYDFLVALFNPKQGTSSLQNDLILPLAKEVFQKYPHAWIDFLEHPEYHISMAFLHKPCNITEAEVKPPASAAKFAPFELQTGELKVVTKGIEPQTIPWPQ